MLERSGLERSLCSGASVDSDGGRVVCSERVERARVRFLLLRVLAGAN